MVIHLEVNKKGGNDERNVQRARARAKKPVVPFDTRSRVVVAEATSHETDRVASRRIM